MKIEIDIESMLSDALAKALTAEALQPIIEKNVTSAVKSTLDDQFGFRSEFRKALDAAVASAMPNSFEDLGRFSDLVLKTVSVTLGGVQNQVVRDALQPKLERMLKPLPPVIKLSELVERLASSFVSGRDVEDDDFGPTVLISRSDSSVTQRYWEFEMHPGRLDSFMKAKVVMRMRDLEDQPGMAECWAMEIDGRDPDKSLFFGPAFNAEALLLALYTGGVKIEVDTTDFDGLEYPEREEDL